MVERFRVREDIRPNEARGEVEIEMPEVDDREMTMASKPNREERQ